jgi:hypothetical protein
MIKGTQTVHFPAFLHLVGQTPLFICFFQSQTNCMETLVVSYLDGSRYAPPFVEPEGLQELVN